MIVWLTLKCQYQDDIDKLTQYTVSVNEMIAAAQTVIANEWLDVYDILPDSPDRNSWGNGTRSGLNQIIGEIYRNAAILLIEHCEGYEFREIDYSVISEEKFEYVIADGFLAFTFEITKTDKQEMLEYGLQYTYSISILCMENPEMISQTFDFTSSIDGISANSLSNEISFVDIDFDGYLDLEIEVGRGNANRMFQYFRWDNVLGKYEETPFFNMLRTGYQLFPDTKQIIAITHDSAASYGRDMYQLIDGNYVLLRHEYAEIVRDSGNESEWIVHISEGQNEIFTETLTVDEYYDISSTRDNFLRYGTGDKP